MPRGFDVEVEKLDLRVGGEFVYRMTASDPAKVAMMEKMGRPASFEVTSVITAADPYRFGYDSPMGPETLSVSVEFTAVDDGVKMVLVIDATKPEMTGGAAMGWRSSLEKFEERLAR
ncbi:MAG: SRPBCC domain-containing protein [Proteobacteria bacterium]|nr:SRPBCC domain-containing protein [Pseudomonadota bacterium]MCP4918444.1 SRPBCC domain-containing protein [Pseudomonadota bacterium]